MLSSFGAVYAPDPVATANELCRVCRHGGAIALTAWPPDSLMGELAAALRDRVPDFPDLDHGWGTPSIAEGFFAGCAEVTAVSRRTLTVDPEVWGAAGAADCAEVFLAKRLPVSEIREVRRRIGAPYVQTDGTLRSDYVVVTAEVH